MDRCVTAFVAVGVVLGGWVSVVNAQQANPTFSVEAVALNGVPLAGAPVKQLTASPGEIITAELYLRDWSPNGEELRAYQIQLDDKAFDGLVSGQIKPTGYDDARKADVENVTNAYIDLDHPFFVHAGMQTIAITDTKRAAGYRWLSVLVDIDKAPVSPQDGTKFYCGTVLLTVSADASGVFRIGPAPDMNLSGLLTEGNRTIGPIDYEPLTITVESGVVRRNIVASDPPAGSIDARIMEGSSRLTGGWPAIQLMFDSDAAPISENEFSISSAGGSPPSIQGIAAAGRSLTLTFNHPLTSGVWTEITHKPTGNTLRFGVLPGDVNGNGTRDSRDLLDLLNMLGSNGPAPAYRADLNGDGTTNTRDALTLIDYLNTYLSERIAD